MTVKTEQQAGATVFRLSGDFDSEDALRKAPAAADVTEKGSHIVLDMGEVAFINSSGITGLVQLVAAANTRGGRVVIANPSPFVEHVLQMTHLNRFFDIAPNVDEAIRKCFST